MVREHAVKAMDTMVLTWQCWLTLVTVVGIFVLLAMNRFPMDFVFLGGLGVLLIAGVLEAREAFIGFSSPGLIAVALLYVVVAGIQETGGLSWISHHVLGRPGSVRKAQMRLMAPVSGISAFLNNTPVVALFIPVVTQWSRRIGVAPSKLLIPLSYASILGGMCTLIGTSTNLVVNGLVQSRFGGEGLMMFEISKVGVPCALIGMGFIVLFPRLLPSRKAFQEVIENPREYTLEMLVTQSGALEGQTIEHAGLRNLPGTFLAELIRGEQLISAVAPDYLLKGGDRLVFVGNVESMRMLYSQPGLRPAPDQIFELDGPRHQRCLVEVVVSNTCPLLGQSIREGRFRHHYNAVVVAVARNGERLLGKIGDIVLRPGDTLLVESHAGFIPRQRDSRDFFLISEVDQSTPKRFDRAPIAFFILAAMVLAVSFGWFSMVKAAMMAAAAMILTGCCSPAQARRTLEWNVLLVIGSALSLAGAMEKTGLARYAADQLLHLTGGHPWMALVAVYFLTMICTEAITNNAAAVLIFPLAMNAAEQLHVSPMPFIICVMIAASAGFATPVGYQTNLMVYGPGGYRFSDYVRIGLPLNVLISAVALTLAPMMWPFL